MKVARSLLGPLGVVVALASLTACTVRFEPFGDTAPARPLVTPRIEFFEPQRGPNTVYRVGEQIGFRIRTNMDGYVTLTALDPDGRVYVFARNIRVQGNRTTLIEGISPRLLFFVDPPLGRHFVRATFTPARTDERVVYSGVRGRDAWLRQLTFELRPFDAFDQRETSFTVRR